MINFGTRRPKLIARIIRMATEPSAIVAPMSSHVLCELFMPAFKYHQKNSLIVFERGHKAHGYVSAGKASKIPTGGPPMTTRLSVTGDRLIWTGLVIDRRYSKEPSEKPIAVARRRTWRCCR